jgi:hypothetical protein
MFRLLWVQIESTCSTTWNSNAPLDQTMYLQFFPPSSKSTTPKLLNNSYRLKSTSDPVSDRPKRIHSNVKIGYQQTSKESALIICETQEFHEPTILLGNMKTIDPNGYKSITFTTLQRDCQREGYDSVKIPRKNGNEFVVYNYDQVVNIKFHK